MVKITGSRDCGNSPKNAFVQLIGVTIEQGELLDDASPDDIVWETPHGVHEGLEAVKGALASVDLPVSIVAEHAITHGKVGATSGVSTLENGKSRRYSHVIEFTNTKAIKVTRIKSYY